MSDALRVLVLSSSDGPAPIVEALSSISADVTLLDPPGVLGPEVTSPPTRDETDLVILATPPMTAHRTAERTAARLPGAVVVDLVPGPPAQKLRMSGLFRDGLYAEGTLCEDGHLELAGPGAARAAELLSGALPVDVVSDVTGAAAQRRILRDILEKGLAAVATDVLWAAEAMGQKDWAHGEITRAFEAASGESIRASLHETARSLKRLQMDMLDIDEALRDTTYQSTTVAAVETNYSRILHGKKIPFTPLR
jgi:hypothetical protein